ncbi:MAG: proprotein convertase P-domain-containing protein, partial [Planctomycetaceae bacterium]|nr:proprotein convertase P-domain-containing protein [Planctomycetaceae bacterium]
MAAKYRCQRVNGLLSRLFNSSRTRPVRSNRNSKSYKDLTDHLVSSAGTEQLEDRLLLTYLDPDPNAGIFEAIGGAGAVDGSLVQVSTTNGNQVAGGIHDVLAHPTNPDILYAASVNGGIWKSTDASGNNPTWVVQTDNLLDANGDPVNQGLSFGSIAFDLTDTIDATPFQTLAAGTGLFSTFNRDGDANPGDPEGGLPGQVFITHDGGNTWENPGSMGLEGQNIISIAIEFDTIIGDYVIMAAASEGSDGNAGGGLFRSEDGGETFVPVVTGDFDSSTGDTNFFAMVADPTVANPAPGQRGRLYAVAQGNGAGLYRSDDFGLSWNKIDTGDVNAAITNPAMNGAELTVHPTTGRLYVGVLHDGQVGGDFDNATGVGGIFYASDADQNTPTWITMDNPYVPVNVTQITQVRNAPDPAQNQNGPQTPPNGIGPATITAPGHGLATGELVLIRGTGNLQGRWLVQHVDPNRVTLFNTDGTPSPAAALNFTAGEIMRIEPSVNASVPTTEDLPQGQIHFSLGTDPSNANIVYFGLDQLNTINDIGGASKTASLWRGDVTRPTGGLGVNSSAPQWDSLTGATNAEDAGSGTASNTTPHRGSRAIVFDANGNLIEADDGGVFRRTSPLNNAGDWVSLAGNLNVFEYHSVAYDTLSNSVIAGSIDNSTHQADIPAMGPVQFDIIHGSSVSAEGVIPFFGIRIPSVLSGGTAGDVGAGLVTSGANNGLSVRYDSYEGLGQLQTRFYNAAGAQVGATTTRSLQTTDGSMFGAQQQTPIAVNALNATNIIFGADNGVYESFNFGDTIDNASAASANIPVTPNAAGPIAYGGRSSQTYGDNPFIIYAGDVDGNLWVRNQSAGEFTPTGLSANRVIDVEINPGEWTEAFAVTENSVHRVTIDAFSDPPVYTSSTDITGDLLAQLPPGSEIFSIEYVNGSGTGVEGLVVGTSTGVYATTIRDLDLGRNTWFQFGTALPDVDVTDMDYDDADDVLILSTLGRGTWKMDDASLFFVPKVSLSVDVSDIPEDGSQSATVTATLSRINPNADVDILLGSSGNAIFTEPGEVAGGTVFTDDYTRTTNAGGGTIIRIPAGQLTGTAVFTAIQDLHDEDDELIQVTAEVVNFPEAEILQNVETTSHASVAAVPLSDPAMVGDPAEVTSSVINVPVSGLITDLDVRVNISHTQTSNLSAVLIAPDGITQIALFNALAAGANVTNAVFDDEAPTSITNGLPPFNGRFRPAVPLDTFDGLDSAGDWTLQITDSVSGDTGTLNSWELTVTRATDPTELPQITIIDDDATPLVQISAAPLTIQEDGSGAGDVATVTISLVDANTGNLSGRDVTVDLLVNAASTATGGNDYVLADMQVVIPAGVDSVTTTVTALQDLFDEFDETVIIDIADANIVNGLADPTANTTTVTIVDDDPEPLVTLTVDDPSGNAKTIQENPSETATITATIDAVSEKDVTVIIDITPLLTGKEADFVTNPLADPTIDPLRPNLRAITVPAGSLTADLTFTAMDDLLDEFDEDFLVDIDSVINGVEDGTQQVTVTIVEDDPEPMVTLTVDDPSGTAKTIAENPAETATITATIDAVSEKDVTVIIDITPLLTGEEADFVTNPLADGSIDPLRPNLRSITIPAGSTTADLTFTAVDDMVDEFDEDFNVDIDSVINGVENGTQQVVVTITEDDPEPNVTLTVNGGMTSQTITENPTEVATIVAELDAVSQKDVTITLAVDGASTATATAPADFTTSSLTILIPAGSTTGSITLTSVDDAFDEFDEDAIINIDTVTNGVEAGNQSVTVTITDEDPEPNVTLTVNGGATAQTITENPTEVATITATIDAVSEKDVTVDLAIDAASTATATAPVDFNVSGLQIVIPAGSTSGTITLTSVDDAFDEFDEDAIINIDAVTNGVEVADQSVTVTIVDEDPEPNVTLTVNGGMATDIITENPNDTAVITATLDAVSEKDVTIQLAIDPASTATATAPIDFTTSSLTITIPAGSTTGTIDLTSVDDAFDEFDEDAIINIDSITNGVEVGAQSVTVTITDDDPEPEVTLTVDGGGTTDTITENPTDTSTVTATIDAVSEKDVTVNLAINGASSATNGLDYTISGLTILIPAGSTTGSVVVTSLDDALDEFDETVIVDIDSVVNAVEVPEEQVTVIITDEDPEPLVTLTSNRVAIRESPSEVATVTATLDAVSQKDVQVTLILGTDTTATDVLDFAISSLTISIPAGSLSGTTTITSVTDSLREFDERVDVEIDSIINAVENGDQEVIITILDENPGPDEVVGIFEEQGGAAVINGQVMNVSPDNRVTGAIEDILAHPTNPDILYIGAINGGIWKTENATAANPVWVPQTDTLESLSIGAIEFDIADNTYQLMVAGTGQFSSFGSQGGDRGRIYVTDDGGDTWESPGSFGLEGENISGVARRGDEIVVTSSESGGGIFRSTDRGVTFTPVNGPDFVSDGSTNFFDLVTDPTTPGRLYAAAEDTGIYRSDNFGLTWTKITGVANFLGDNQSLQDDITNNLNNNLEMTVHPTTGRLYLGVVIAGQVGGIYYTSNGDQPNPTWIEMDVPLLPLAAPTPITGAAGSDIVITAAGHGLASGDTVIVRNVEGNTNANGFWTVTVIDADNFSLNGSVSGPAAYVANTGEVVPVTNPSPGFKPIDESGSQGRIHFSITTDPTDHNIVYIGGDRQEQPNLIGDVLFGGSIFRGDASLPRDPGAVPSPQWDHITNNPTAFDPGAGTASNSGTHADSRDMTFDANGNLIEVDDGGIFRRTSPRDNTGDWFSLAGNLGVVEYHSIGYDAVSNLIVGGTQDNGTHAQVAPGSTTFRMISGGDGGDVAIDAVSRAGAGQSIRYISSQFLGGFRSVVFDAAGNQISATGRGLNTTDGSVLQPQFYTPVVLNELVPTSMIIGAANGVYESFNQGDTADNAGAGIRATGSVAGPLAYGGRSAVNGDNRFVIYAGDTSGRVHVRTEAAGPFDRVQDLGSAIRDVEMDPNEWTRAFAVNSESVWMTEDGGQTWTNITTNLHTVGAGSIYSIQYINGVEEGIVVGTDRGVFATTINHLGTWFRYGSGLPDVHIRDMEYNADQDLLILGTLGRGAWRMDNASTFLLPNVVLSTNTITLPEDGSRVATITARLSRQNPDADVIIDLSSGGTATFTESTGTGAYPDDYSRTDAQLIIPAGQLFATTTITALQDNFDEDDEVIQVTATNITEAQLYVRNVASTETRDYSSTGAVAIGDLGVATSTVSIPDVGHATDINVTLDLSHSLTSDLEVTLISPDGTRILLANAVGAGADFTGTIFDDEAGTDIAAGANPFTGSFRPSEALSGFDTLSVQGDWTLEINDTKLGDTGTLNGWTLTVEREIEPNILPEITIIDDDELPLVRLFVAPGTVQEDGSAGNATITAVLFDPNTLAPIISGREVTVDLTVDALSSATDGLDYNLSSLQIVIPRDTPSATVTLTPLQDLLDEFDENVIIDIDSVTNGVEDGDQQVIVTLVDDDPEPLVTLTVDDPAVTSKTIQENPEGTAIITATIDAVSQKDVTVVIDITPLLTGKEADFVTTPLADPTIDPLRPNLRSITIPAGSTTADLLFTAADDLLDEFDEDFLVDIDSVTNGVEDGTQQVIVTIAEDDPEPLVTLTVDDPAVTTKTIQENPAETATITATIDAVSEKDVTVIIDITPLLTGKEADFDTNPLADPTIDPLRPNLRSITIPAGSLTADFTFTAVDDLLDEFDENFNIDIDSVINGVEDGTQQVVVTIVEDDPEPLVTLTVDDPSGNTKTILENPAETATITATIDAVSEKDVTVIIDITPLLTGQEADFATNPLADPTIDPTRPNLRSITIPAGSTTADLTFSAVDDLLDEFDEDFNIDIDTVINGVEDGTQQVVVTIVEDDPEPLVTLTLDDPSGTAKTIAENPAGTAVITATIDAVSEKDVTVVLDITPLLTGKEADFATTPAADPTIDPLRPNLRSITIPAGSTTADLTFTAVDDLLDEFDEDFLVDIDNVTNGVEDGTQQVTVTITEDDPLPQVTLTVDDPSGDAKTIQENPEGTAIITATIDAVSEKDVTVVLDITPLLTGQEADFTTNPIADPTIDPLRPNLRSITIPAGSTSADLTFTAEDDLFDEFDEDFLVDIDSVTNGVENGTQQVTVTIVDDDELPGVTLSVDSNAITEAPISTAVITATLDAVSEKDVTVTLGVSGVATGGGDDYTDPATTIVIPAGSLTASTSITTVDNNLYEDDETVIIDITGVVNGVETGMQQQIITILEDDPRPVVTLESTSSVISENSGSALIVARLDAVSALDVVIDFAFSGTATGGGVDYQPPVTQITIPAGALDASIILEAVPDIIDEADETVIIDVASATNSTLGTPSSLTVVIADDDLPALVSLDAPADVVENGGTGVFTISLNTVSGRDITVNLGVSNSSTATGGGVDYTDPVLQVMIPAGTLSTTTSFTAVDDAVDEFDETVVLEILSVIQGTENGEQIATATILDDDASPTVTLDVAPLLIDEGAETSIVTVSLNVASERDVIVDLAVSGTATGGGIDYINPETRLVIPAGQTVVTTSLTSVQDLLSEDDETVIIDIDEILHGVESGGLQQQTVVIEDNDDPTLTLTLDAAEVNELDGVAATVGTVFRNTDISVPLTVTMISGDPTEATAPVEVTIPVGAVSASFLVAAVNDMILDGTQTATFTATAPGFVSDSADLDVTDSTFEVNLTASTLVATETDATVITLEAVAASPVIGNQSVEIDISGAGITPDDYVLGSNVLIIADGQTTASTTLTIVDDSLVELVTELLTVELVNASIGLAPGANASEQIAVTDNDAATITIDDVTQLETNSGTSALQFTITMDAEVDTDITFNVSTVDGTATAADNDFVAVNNANVGFQTGGSLTRTIIIQGVGDTKVELDESFTVELTNLVALGRTVSITDAVGTATLTNDDAALISIADVRMDEGDSGFTAFTFDLTLSADVDAPVSVQANTADGTATVADSDYSLVSNIPVGFTPNFGGPQTQTLTVQVVGDMVVEDDEDFTVLLSGLLADGRNVLLDDAEATGTIVNDDAARLSVANVAVLEGDAGTTQLTFEVTLSDDVNSGFSVDYSVAAGTATSGIDFTPVPGGTLNFAGTAGEIQTVTVDIAGDEVVELDETILLNLSNLVASGLDVTLDSVQAVGTITNDDAATLAVNNIQVFEGDSGLASVFFEVTLTGEVDSSVAVDYATEDGTATLADSDYVNTTGTVRFDPLAGSSQTRTFAVQVRGDEKVELDETFFTNLSALAAGGRNVTIVDNRGQAQIVNDDAAALTVADVSVTEGDAGSSTLTFSVTLDAEVDETVTVDYSSVAGTATVGQDYAADVSDTLTFAANAGGSQVLTVNIDVTGDEIAEADETLQLLLSNLVGSGRNVAIGDGEATGTIIDDDQVIVTVGSVMELEGDSGNTIFRVPVSIEGAADSPIELSVNTSSVNASASQDYVPIVNGTISFTGQPTEDTGFIDVEVIGDATVELDEVFNVTVADIGTSGIDVVLAEAIGVVTITNDDSAEITIADVSTEEGNSGNTVYSFAVTLSEEVDIPISLTFATQDGTATTADNDYVAGTGGVTFQASNGPGPQTQTISIFVLGDQKVELDESFSLLLAGLSSGGRAVSITDDTAQATILNDDAATLTVTDASLTEGDAGSRDLVFTVALDGEVDVPVLVNATPGGGTAVDGVDYAAGGLRAYTFATGNGTRQTRTLTVPIFGDEVVELNETLLVSLTGLEAGGRNVRLESAQGTGTILNDDAARVLLNNISIQEGSTGNTLNFNALLDATVDTPFTADYATVDGTATAADGDYTATSGTLNFAGFAFETQQFSVDIGGDTTVELDEVFQAFLSNLQAFGRNVSLANAVSNVTLENDDAAGLTIDDVAMVEGQTGQTAFTFTVSLDNDVDTPFTVDFQTQDGTAVAPEDYTSTSGSLAFAGTAAETQTITVLVNGDGVVELEETFTVVLSDIAAGDRNVTLTDGSGLGTISNEDTVMITISDAEILEGHTPDTAFLAFTVTRDNATIPIDVDFTTVDGTATAGSDYVPLSGTLNFPAGSPATATVVVEIIGDHIAEADETLFLDISTATIGAAIADSRGVGTILQDDGFVSGQKWLDQNGNGVRDAGEPGLDGWTIRLLNAAGQVVSSTVTTSIDLDGNNVIDPITERGLYTLPAGEGDWFVEEVLQTGWRQTSPSGGDALAFQLDQELGLRTTGRLFENWGGLGEKWLFGDDGWYFITPVGDLFEWDGSPRGSLTGRFIASLDSRFYDDPSLLTNAEEAGRISVTVTTDQTVADVNFGNVPTGTIQGRKFHDADADGRRDITEPWLAGWTIDLRDASGNVIQTAITGDLDLNDDGVIDPATETGWYQFTNLLPAEYTITERNQPLWSTAGSTGPFVEEAYLLDQQLQWRVPQRDFLNWGGLNEKWLWGRGAGWHYVTPNGSIFEWDGSPSGNLTGRLIATFDSTYYDDLSLIHNPRLPASYTVTVNGQTISDLDFANSFGHDGSGSGDVTVTVSGGIVTLTGDVDHNTIAIYKDANGNTVVTGVDQTTINGLVSPVVVLGDAVGINANLGGGNDQLAIYGTTMTGDIAVNTGSGADEVVVSDAVVDELSINNPSGDDTQRIRSVAAGSIDLDGGGRAAIESSQVSGG